MTPLIVTLAWDGAEDSRPVHLFIDQPPSAFASPMDEAARARAAAAAAAVDCGGGSTRLTLGLRREEEAPPWPLRDM